jgi:hypothetical protein
MIGLDIRCAPGEQQSVANVQERRQIQVGSQGGHEHRHRIGAGGDGIDVFLADHVEIVVSIQPAIGWNSDERHARHV